jgi:uncharacterized protein (UPF0218 family)
LTEEIWSKTIHFSEQVKDMVRKPLGDLYYGNVSYSRELAEAKPLVVVGDYTFTLLVKAGVRPSVAVLDAKIERGTVGLPPLEGYRIVKVRNNPGTISPEAAEAVTEAVRTGNVAVVVEGRKTCLLSQQYMPCQRPGCWFMASLKWVMWSLGAGRRFVEKWLKLSR